VPENTEEPVLYTAVCASAARRNLDLYGLNREEEGSCVENNSEIEKESESKNEMNSEKDSESGSDKRCVTEVIMSEI
jgi:hypothetical protein